MGCEQETPDEVGRLIVSLSMNGTIGFDNLRVLNPVTGETLILKSNHKGWTKELEVHVRILYQKEAKPQVYYLAETGIKISGTVTFCGYTVYQCVGEE